MRAGALFESLLAAPQASRQQERGPREEFPRPPGAGKALFAKQADPLLPGCRPVNVDAPPPEAEWWCRGGDPRVDADHHGPLDATFGVLGRDSHRQRRPRLLGRCALRIMPKVGACGRSLAPPTTRYAPEEASPGPWPGHAVLRSGSLRMTARSSSLLKCTPS